MTLNHLFEVRTLDSELLGNRLTARQVSLEHRMWVRPLLSQPSSRTASTPVVKLTDMTKCAGSNLASLKYGAGHLCNEIVNLTVC